MKCLLLPTLGMTFLLAATTGLRAAVTNNVTGGNGTDYTVNSLSDPALTLLRGTTYIFKLSNITIHPFNIRTTLGGSQFTNGVTGNGSTSGELIFAVPTNAPNTLFYQCGNHFGMNATLTIINPPTPPPFSILGLSVSNNLRLRHTGTNTFTYTPEFTTNLVTTNWITLIVQSNVFTGGTNDIFCGLPPGTNIFLRIRAQ